MTNSDNSLVDFVKNTFGDSEAKKLKNIHTGGLSNSKGGRYESFYHLYKIFEIAGQNDCQFDKHIVEAQAFGFIDDLVHIDFTNNSRTNYQAKNSDNSTADWTEEISSRVNYQIKIDTEFHKAQHSFNHLLVSSLEKFNNNQLRIPNSLKANAYCTHFPDYQTLIELGKNPTLKVNVIKLIDSESKSDIDYAIKLIDGCIKADNNQTLENIFKQAESKANPNPFIVFKKFEQQKALPQWLLTKLEDFADKIASSEIRCDRFILKTKSGLEAQAPIDKILSASISEIEAIIDLKHLYEFILRKEAEILHSST
jgi:hypothetical protein